MRFMFWNIRGFGRLKEENRLESIFFRRILRELAFKKQ
jgi:hypothetical protein